MAITGSMSAAFNIVSSSSDIRWVSILIQPEGRMQPLTESFPESAQKRFQSSSSPKAGCNCHKVKTGSDRRLMFQSSSSPKAGCNCHKVKTGSDRRLMFQSSSSPKAGCNSWRWTACPMWPACFNPHPARRPDATAPGFHWVKDALPCFNPHPARRPDATASVIHWVKDALPCFNPHPARRPDATHISLDEI